MPVDEVFWELVATALTEALIFFGVDGVGFVQHPPDMVRELLVCHIAVLGRVRLYLGAVDGDDAGVDDAGSHAEAQDVHEHRR